MYQQGTSDVGPGHNIVADGWAGASNPQPPQTPLHTQTFPMSARNAHFSTIDSITSTDGRTDGQSLL